MIRLYWETYKEKVVLTYVKYAKIKSMRPLAQCGVIAALYAALTCLLAPISFSMMQVRVSEALTLLPIISPVAPWGLFVGCFLANVVCGAPILDIIFGPLATLAAALLTRALRKNLYLAALPPVAVNGLVVGWVLWAGYGLPLAASMATVALGEAIACYALGLPLMWALKKLPESALRGLER